jgi:AcrR family transcriptional regulator
MPSGTSRNGPAGPTTGRGSAPARPGSASARTREQLVLAGERLFAEQGVDNVSLRQINAAAGQRNSSAAHYHFGSKESLVRAIYDYRMERVEARRRALLEGLASGGADAEVRALVEALVLPLQAEVDDSEGGVHFIRFLAQLFNHPAPALRGPLRNEFADAVGRIYYRLRMLLPAMPDALFATRFGLAWELAVSGLADRTRRLEGPGAAAEPPPALFVSNLVDAAVAILVTPPSPATARQLAALGPRPPG